MAITECRTFILQTDAETVHRYLADFSHTQEWDPATIRCRRTDSTETPAIGNRWTHVSRFRGREATLDYELVDLSASRLVFVGTNRTVTARDEFRITPMSLGCRLDYQATLRFQGLARLAEPLLRGAFATMGEEVARALPAHLNTL